MSNKSGPPGDDLTGEPCTSPGCERPGRRRYKGQCASHYMRGYREKKRERDQRMRELAVLTPPRAVAAQRAAREADIHFYDERVHPGQLKRSLMSGLQIPQIAINFGVSEETLLGWISTYPAMIKASRFHRAAKEHLRVALWNKALGPWDEERGEFLGGDMQALKLLAATELGLRADKTTSTPDDSKREIERRVKEGELDTLHKVIANLTRGRRDDTVVIENPEAPPPSGQSALEAAAMAVEEADPTEAVNGAHIEPVEPPAPAPAPPAPPKRKRGRPRKQPPAEPPEPPPDPAPDPAPPPGRPRRAPPAGPPQAAKPRSIVPPR